MGRETPSPKDQGFLNNANRFRVSRDLTQPLRALWMDMRSIFRNPAVLSSSGDGEAKHVRTDGMVR